MSKKYNTIAIGTSPFIYSYLKIKKIEATVYDNNYMDFLGGMWSNTRFENKDFVLRAKQLDASVLRNAKYEMEPKS